MLKVLFFGDLVGAEAVYALKKNLPFLLQKYEAHCVIVNAENAYQGKGISQDLLEVLTSINDENEKIDIITSGNHIWAHKEIYPFLSSVPYFLRPLNYIHSPGKGYCLWSIEIDNIQYSAVIINLMGQSNMNVSQSPFDAIDQLLETIKESVVIIDFHAEDPQEKEALAFYLRGRVSAVLGTHTHVQTADAMLIDQHTAYITDVGACSARQSIIGNLWEPSNDFYLHRIPLQIIPKDTDICINGVYLEIDQYGKTHHIETL